MGCESSSANSGEGEHSAAGFAEARRRVFEGTLVHVYSNTEGGAERIVQIYEHFLNLNAGHWPLRQFIANERGTALRLLTSNQGVQHQRLIDRLRRLLEAAAAAGELNLRLEAADMAFVLVRLGESFIWREFITGEEPDAVKAVQVARVLLA